MRSVGTAACLLAVAACAPLEPPPLGPPLPSQDACAASAVQWLVGRDRSEIPPPGPTQVRRIYPRGGALTMDHSPTRLNIEYDPQTGRVLRAYCG